MESLVVVDMAKYNQVLYKIDVVQVNFDST